MAPPIPSFFKIRLSIILIVFVIFCFLVGLAKNVFAEVGHVVNGECYGYYWDVIETGNWNSSRVVYFGEHSGGYYIPQTSTDSGEKQYRLALATYRYSNGSWFQLGTLNGYADDGYKNWASSRAATSGATQGVFPSSYAPNGCIENCQEARDALEESCGAGNYFINEDTCEGMCKCTDDDEDGVCNQCDLDPHNKEITNKVYAWKRLTDNSGNTCRLFYTYLEDQCQKLFNQNKGNFVNITELYSKENENAQCDGTERIEFIPCNEYQLNGNCDPECSDSCPGGSNFSFPPNNGDDDQPTNEDIIDNNPDEDDEDHRQDCYDKCYPKGYMYISGTDECVCVNDNDGDGDYDSPTTPPVDDRPKTGIPPSTNPPDVPDIKLPSPTPAPDAPDSDFTKATTGNTDATATNTGTLVEQTADTNDSLTNIDTNTGSVVDNTAGIIKEVDTFSDRNIARLQKILNEIRGDGSSNEHLSYTVPGEYNPAGDGGFSWGERTNEFLSDMQTTGIFSIPTEFFDSIPSGGSGVFNIDGGDTFGTHQLDFSAFSVGLLALRAVIQIAFMWLAIRIVTLKR